MKRIALFVTVIFSLGLHAQIPGVPVTFLLDKLQCPSILDSATRASLYTGDFPKGPIGPNDLVETLGVRLNTSSALFADTNDEVWLDVGPKAWKIGNSFPRGSSQTFKIDLDTADPAIDLPTNPKLRVKDLAVLRLEKKGICGLTNAPDSNYAIGMNDLTPAAFVAQAQKQVDLAKYLLHEQQAALAQAQAAFDRISAGLNAFDAKVADAEKSLKEIPGKLGNLQQQIDKASADIALLPVTVADKVCHDERSPIKCAILGPLCFQVILVCQVQQVANPAIQRLKDAINGFSNQKNSFAAQLAEAQITVSTMATVRGPLLASKTAAQAQLDLLKLQIKGSQAAADLAAKALAEAQELAKKLPGLELPRIGQWTVESVALIVNGHELYKFFPNTTLRQGQPEWREQLTKMSGGEEFSKRLRMTLNRGNNSDRPNLDQILAGPLTAFKVAGFSGWLPTGVGGVTMTGKLRNKPSVGSDGIVSLDLELERAKVAGRTFKLANNEYGVRYIRAEYAYAAEGRNDTRVMQLDLGDRLEISGDLLWDTDRNGFYEVHPVRPEDIRVLPVNEKTSFWKRLFGG